MYCRYVLNYLPFGVAYKVCNLLPSKLVIVSLRELHRAQQIHTGFIYASAKFQDSVFTVAVYSILVGWYRIGPRHLLDSIFGAWA